VLLELAGCAGAANDGAREGFLSAAERILVGDDRALLSGPVGTPFSCKVREESILLLWLDEVDFDMEISDCSLVERSLLMTPLRDREDFLRFALGDDGNDTEVSSLLVQLASLSSELLECWDSSLLSSPPSMRSGDQSLRVALFVFLLGASSDLVFDREPFDLDVVDDDDDPAVAVICFVLRLDPKIRIQRE
jgi:hypothetical protein